MSELPKRVYAHWFKDVKTEAINNLAKQLFRAAPDVEAKTKTKTA